MIKCVHCRDRGLQSDEGAISNTTCGVCCSFFFLKETVASLH